MSSSLIKAIEDISSYERLATEDIFSTDSASASYLLGLADDIVVILLV